MRKMLLGTLILTVCLAGTALHADTESTSALYLLGGVDGKLLTNTDADNYFGVPSDLLGPKGYASPVVHLGLQIGRWMAVELSGNFGPDRYNQVSYSSDGGLETRQVTTHWNLDTYSVTPALTWAGPEFVNFLGLRVGMANLYGHVEDDADGADGSYDQRATTPDIGVLFRTSQIFVDHFSIGLELGYDHTVFNYITNQNGSGTYANVSSPEHNVSGTGHNGPQTTLDFSGPHIAIIVGLWTSAPVHEVGDADDATPAQ